jgi:hypothetical protein
MVRRRQDATKCSVSGKGRQDPKAEMDSGQLHDLAEAWLKEQRSGAGSDAWYRAQRLASTDPEPAWELALEIVRLASDELLRPPFHDGIRLLVASLAALVVGRDATAFVDRFEREAVRNPAFRTLFPFMRIASTAALPEVMARLDSATGGRLRIYPGHGTALAHTAYEVACEFRDGRLPDVPPGTRSPSRPLADEIARRRPGYTAKEYREAARVGLELTR